MGDAIKNLVLDGDFAVPLRGGSVRFPANILASICKMAVWLDPPAAAKLACVSKDIHKWIAPYLHHTIILKRVNQLVSFSRTVQTASCMLGYEVRVLIIHGNGFQDMMDYVEAAIRGCQNLETLLIDGDVPPPSVSARLPCVRSTYPNPKHAVFLDQAGIKPTPILRQVRHHALLQSVTHLHIHVLNVEDSDQGMLDLTGLIGMASLTHLACGYNDDKYEENFVECVTDILRRSSVLRVFLLLSFDLWNQDLLVGSVWLKLSQLTDERLLAGHAVGADDYVSLVSSGGTIWDHAEIRCRKWREKVEGKTIPMDISDEDYRMDTGDEGSPMQVDGYGSEDEVAHHLRGKNQAEDHRMEVEDHKMDCEGGDGVYSK